MSGTWCVIPVKRLQHAKQRLSSVLSPRERRALVLAMLRDVLDAVSAADLDGILLATSDDEATALGRAYGAEALADPAPETSLSAVVEHALTELARSNDASRAIVLAADLPFVEAVEISALARSAPGSVALAADRWGIGTNAIALDPGAPMRLAFGPASLERHRAIAAERGLPVSVMDLPSLAFDVDTPDDLRALALYPGVRHASALARQVAERAPV